MQGESENFFMNSAEGIISFKDILRKFLSIFLCLCILINLSFCTDVKAYESGVPFAGFNSQNVNMSSGNWSTINASVSTTQITMAGNTGTAAYYINLSEIADSIDCGSLKIDFSVRASIGSEDTAELDNARAKIYFRANEVGENLSSVVLERGTDNPGTAIVLSSNAAIPVGTRFIFIELEGEKVGSANTVVFTQPSLYIRDNNDPVLTADRVTDWTNQNVVVTLHASDTQSGIAGIFNSADSSKVADGTSYQYTAAANRTDSFYTLDYSGRSSEILEVAVNNMDKNAPAQAPDIMLSKTTWSNAAVTFTLSNITAATGESPETRQYRLNGGTWTNYTGIVTIGTEGQTVIDSRTVDAAGNTSGQKTATAYVDTTSPVISTLSAVTHTEGGATVTFVANDGTGSGLLEKRWAAGTQNAAYFATSGTILTGNTFDIVSGGTYTVFAKDNVGNTTINTITINTYPTVPSISSQTLDEDGQKNIDFSVSDSETPAGSLTVSAASSNTALLPNPQCTNTNGNVRLALKPVANMNGGPVTVTVSVTDGGGNTSTTQFTVMINSVNDVPVAVDDGNLTTDEDHALVINPLQNDTDVENSTLHIASTGNAAHGTVSIASDGLTVTYTPNNNYNGTDSFTYTVSDGTDISNTATITVQVTEVNDDPVANDDTLSILEDESPLINVLANDTDADVGTTPDEVLSISQVGTPSHGTAVQQNGKILYTPQLNWYGEDSFTYQITDRKGVTASATVFITVRSSNDAPVFAGLSDEYTVTEDCGASEFSFQISDVETQTASLMLQAVSTDDTIIPTSSLTIDGLGNSDGNITVHFTPVENANGNVSFVFRLSDGFIVTQKTVVIHVTPVNDLPQTEDDAYSYTEDDNSLIIDMDDLTLNDTDIDQDTLYFDGIAMQPTHGTLEAVNEAEHTYRYLPELNYNGAVTFSYKLSDGTDTVIGFVTLTGTAVNDVPVINMNEDNVYQIQEDQTASNIHFTISDQETVPKDLIVTVESSNSQIVSADKIAITKEANGDCSLSIVPNANQNGKTTITIHVSDGLTTTDSSFELTIDPVEDAPVAENDYVYINENETRSIFPLANDYDVDGDPITIVSFNQPTHGTVSQEGNTLYYQCNLGYHGLDSFDYTISDGNSQASGTVYVSIGGYFFPPVIKGISNQFILEDSTTGALPFHVFDADVEDTLTVTATSANTALVPNDNDHMKLTYDAATGNCTITAIPYTNAFGSSTITLKVADPMGNTDESSFLLTVYPVNDAPQPQNDTVTVNEDQSVTFNVLDNDWDMETSNENLKTISVTQPSNGWLTVSNGVYTYTPYPNFHGTDTFDYTMTDGETNATATVSITVNAVNDAPILYDIYYELPNVTGSESSAPINILSNSYDVDGDTCYTDSIVSQPQYGTAHINEDGTVTYTRSQISPASNGADSFTVKIRDRATPQGDVLYSIATVYIGVDFIPSLAARTVSIRRNEDCDPFWINLNYANPNGNTMQITTSNPTLGTITQIDAVNGRILFTPNPDANGNETIAYTITDNTIEPVQTKTSYIYLMLTPVNDPPRFTVLPADTVTDEDTSTGWLDVSFEDPDTAGNLIFTVSAQNQDANHPVILQSGIDVDRTGNSLKLRFNPVANANGNAVITMQASDGLAMTTRTFKLTVNSINDAPVAEDYTYGIKEDTSVAMTVIKPNSDVEGDALTISIGEGNGPSNGTAVIDGSAGTITYTPNHDFYGTDTITYTLDDGNGGTDTGLLTINVENVNDNPVISGLKSKNATLEDQTITIPFTVSDADNDPLDITLSDTNPALFPSGSVTITGTGSSRSIVAVPKSNAFGTQYITVTVNDGHTTVTQTITIQVISVNDIPVAADDNYTVTEDTPATFNVLANDSDVEDGNAIKVVAVDTTGSHGTVTVNSDGTLTYAPNANYNGTDSFQYTVSDSNGGHDSATVSIQVDSVNDNPVVQDDTVTTDEDVAITIDVLANDSDVEGQMLTVQTAGAGASLAQSILINADNTITYTPALNQNGTDTFTYVVTDDQEQNNTSTGTVTVQIRPFNDPPEVTNNAANPGDWVFNEDNTGAFLFNLSDPETDVRNLILTLTSSDQTLIQDTSITYSGSGQVKTVQLVPLPNKNGSCDIIVHASDGVNTVEKAFHVTVTSVNDKPTINTKDLITNEDTPVSGQATGADVESSNLTFSLRTQEGDGPSHGTVTVAQNGGYTYTPDPNFNGSDSFIVVVDDGSGMPDNTNESLVHVTVNPVNDAPVANNDTATTDEDVAVTIDALANDTDIDADASLNVNAFAESLSISDSGFSGVDNGTASVSNGKIIFTPALNWNGSETFTYTVRDAVGATDTATVTVTVNPVDDVPAGGNDSYTVTEDTAKSLNVLSNDDIDMTTNPGVEELTVTGIYTNPSHGSVQIVDNKTITYTPAENYYGADSFVYDMKDKDNHTGRFTVTLNVTSVNDVPTISAIDDQTINEDNSTGALAFTVDDVEDNDGSLTILKSSSNTTLIPTANIVCKRILAGMTVRLP